MKKILLFSALATSILITSCSKKTPITTDEVPEEVPYNSLTANSNYLTTFVDDNGESTVDFSGQTARTNMLSELDAYMRTATSTTISAAKMQNMFEHKNSPFEDADLNSATTKIISAKTAQSFSAALADVERQRFIGYFEELARVSALNGQEAEQGKAGMLGGKRLVDEKGFEYNQFVQKGLIGALMLDQISNIYLGADKQSADNTTAVEGKNYTALEHNWDEAYGYLTSNEMYPKADPSDATKYLEKFLGNYVRQVGPAVGGDPQAIYMAFLKGRAAIVNEDYTMRDEQLNYIRKELEEAIATISISYLNKAMGATDNASKFHSLSEAVGFIYSLRYAHAAKINIATSDNLVNKLTTKQDGFWSLTNADLEEVRNQIATTFSIDKSTVVNH